MGTKRGDATRNRKLIRAVILLGMLVVMLNSVIIVIIYHPLNNNNPLSHTTSLISGAAIRSSQEIISETVSLCNNNPLSITAIGNQKVVVGEGFALQVKVNSPRNNTFLQYYDNTSLFEIDSSGYIKFTPNENQASQHILITVKDASGCANQNSTEIFLLTIINSESTITISKPKAARADPAPSLPPEPPMLPPVPIAGIDLATTF